MKLSHGHGGGGEVPLLSLGDLPLFDLRQKRIEDSILVRFLWGLIWRRGGREYLCWTWVNQASHSVEVAVVRCRASYECEVPGSGSLIVVAVLARAFALSFPGWPLIQVGSMRRFVWESSSRGVAR